jgi:hypothetical protein
MKRDCLESVLSDMRPPLRVFCLDKAWIERESKECNYLFNNDLEEIVSSSITLPTELCYVLGVEITYEYCFVPSSKEEI